MGKIYQMIKKITLDLMTPEEKIEGLFMYVNGMKDQ